ncbi:MAG: galactokinase, partial [Gemmatimonadetes bacterium]|nr:galactokinase [Gemmatimonadota bacterium]
MTTSIPDHHSLLRRAFAERFGEAGHVARAPGRVNLIGEHTDYNGLPVLPMALDREVVIAFRPRADHRVILHNVEPRFPTVEFELAAAVDPDRAGAWGNYPRAAGQALWAELGPLRGIEGVVGSTVPVAAGLSSSSALVVAIAVALLDANQRSVERRRLMDLLASGERYVGLQGGGMDQAISLGGRAGHALRIDFRPLRLTPVPVPADWVFLVASTGIEAAKAAGARDAYNTRVSECREALARFSATCLGGKAPGDYQELLRRIAPEEAILLADGALSGHLLQRFRHVVTEGRRVDLAQQAMEGRDLDEFGRLMRASHQSLRDDYEVSSTELDRLVDVAQTAGAVGARLTGAGFGGCIVALASRERAGPVENALQAVSPVVL